MKKLITVKTVTEMLGHVGPAPVLKLIALGQLPAVNVSSGPGRPSWRIDPDDVKAFLEGRRAVPPAPPAPRRKRYASATPVTEYFR